MSRVTTRLRAHAASERLARALASLVGTREVGQRVVRAVADAVQARVVSLAVREPASERLAIVAAVGYPLALVEYVRVPGAPGVLNAVYQSRVPLRADDVANVPGVAGHRPRYTTRSCMAWPLLAGTELVGILCVADRADGQPFSRDDMSALRALASPITLALSRECARDQMEALAHAATVDPISGLFNRRYFHHRLAEELERARRHGMPVALAMLDLDGFKAVNDMFGHLAGDAVIREAAETLRHSVRVFDICTRFGGDEFAVVMPGSSHEAANRIAERVRERIGSGRFFSAHGVVITASIGIAVAATDIAPADFIAQADRALYLAKRLGKNRVSSAS